MNEELKNLYQNHNEAKSKMTKGIVFLIVSELVASIFLVASAFDPAVAFGVLIALPFLCVGISFLVIGLKRMKKYNLLIEQKKIEVFTESKKENIVFENGFQKNANPLQNGKIIDDSKIDQLKKFKELLDSGVITQEEFDAQKKQLLGI